VWFTEARTWTTRAGHDRDSAPTPFVVTITVPEAWREELSRRAIGALRTALTRNVARDDVGVGQYRGGHASSASTVAPVSWPWS
jgi:hypothetical protein